MIKNYQDNPLAVEEWLEAATPREKQAFNKGFLQAVYAILEQISESKRKIVNSQIEHMDNPSVLAELESRMHILDLYDEHYTRRAKNLSRKEELV